MASEVFRGTSSARWVVGALLCLVVALGFVLRFHDLAANDLTEDEELATGLPLLGYGDLLTGISGRPPLSFFTQKVVIDIAGSTSPVTLRLPRVIEGCAAIVVLFLFMRSAWGSRAGLLAAALLSLNHFHVYWSRDARYYPMLTLCAVLALFGLWNGGLRGRPAGLAIFAAGMAGAVLTHYAGYLFAASLVLVLPVVLWSGPWMQRLRQYPPRRIVAAAALLFTVGLLAAWFLRDYLGRVTRHLQWPDATQPLSPLFDVSPPFLWNRAGEMLGASGFLLGLVALLGVVGLLHGARKSPAWGALSFSVMATPFILYYLFPPAHPWNTKYFIFIVPILVANVSLGVLFLSRVPAQWPRTAWLAAPVLLCGLAAYAIPNASRIGAMYAHPDTAQQDLGADLTRWSTAGETTYYTWPERPRVLRHYYPPADDPHRQRMLTEASSFPALYADSGNPWICLDGKSDTPSTVAAELLSARYTRVAYDVVFLARAPGIQRIAFGETLAGSPEQQGPLDLEPGGERSIEVLVPRDFDATLLLEAFVIGEARGSSIDVSLSGHPSATAKVGKTKRPLPVSVYRLERGPARLRLHNTGKVPVRIVSMGLVPALGDGPLTLPAWDFYSLTGSEVLASVWPDERPEGMLVRDMRHGQAATYRFHNDRERRVSIRLRALNDPPHANQYQLHLSGTELEYHVLSFDLENGELSWQQSPELVLPPGAHLLSVGYIGLGAAQFNEDTRNGRVLTEESLQNSGLHSIEIVPMS